MTRALLLKCALDLSYFCIFIQPMELLVATKSAVRSME